MHNPKVFFLTAALILLSFSGARAGGRYEYPFSQNLKIEPGTKVIIENLAGDIRVIQGPAGQLTVDGKKVIRAPSRKVAEEEAGRINIVVKRENGEVHVGVEDGGRRTGVFSGFRRGVSSWVDFNLLIPPETGLKINSTSGDITAKGVEGEVTVKTVSGDLSLVGLNGMVMIHTVSGDVDLKGIEGAIWVEGTSSDLYLSGIKGDMEISTTSGDIKGQDIEGNLTVEGTSGDVGIMGIRGDLRASLHSGDVKADMTLGGARVKTTSGDVYIRASLQEGKDYQVDTSSGDVVFKIKEEESFKLVIDTASGEINVKVPLIISSISRNHIEGKVGEGGATVRIVTSSGDIGLSQ